jgi:hypothetical protein
MTIIFNGTTGIAGAGSVTGMTVANTAISGTITSSQLANAAQYTGFKNRIINGNMNIDQYNNGGSITPSVSNIFCVDRWKTSINPGGKFSVQQNSGNAPASQGFSQCLKVTSLSAYTLGSTEFEAITQYIEGNNIADLGWGTASAKTVTLSFWVNCSVAGTFGGSLLNSSQNYNYPYSYTINSVNTWEYKTVTIAGPTSGTWNTNSSDGIRLLFTLGCGATYSQAAGTWTTSTALSATGATSLVATNGATFYITGVQLEVGTAATSFDFRSFGTELLLCQRYYERSYDVGQATASFTGGARGTSTNATVYNEGPGWSFLVAKRTAPTVVFYNLVSGASARAYQVSSAASITVGARYIGQTGITIIDYTSSGGQNSYYIHYTADAEL